MGKGENEASQDFGAILEAFEREQEAPAGSGKDPQIGEKVSGRILTLGDDVAFVDLGGKTEGMVHLAELVDDDGEITVAVGDTVEGMVAARDPESGCLVIRVRAGRGGGDDAVAREELRQAQEHRIPVEGTVREVVKGGVTVEVLGLRGFCPISQLDVRFVEDASEYVGRRLQLRVIRYEESGRGGRPNIVLSRRELLEEEARRRAEETRAGLEVGKVLRGTVTSVTNYGAFVDLGGLEGLLHVSEMSHGRVEDPSQIYTPGQEVEVEVLKIEPGRKAGESERISLSRRSFEKDPWEGATTRYPEERRVEGRVVRVEPFGAFVELEPGLEGLVHVSELGLEERVRDAREVIEPGRTVEVRVLGIDPARRRISLSMGKSKDERELREEVDRYRSSQPSGSGGFGSLGDFFKSGKINEGGSGSGVAKRGKEAKTMTQPSETRASQPELSKILVTTDFSSEAVAGVEWAASLARRLSAAVVLLYVVEDHLPPILIGVSEAERRKILEEHRERAMSKLVAYAEESLGDCRYTVAARIGTASREILRHAEEEGQDLIVMASHGYGPLRQVLLGSTAERVLHHASCPVMIVPSRRS